jgi:hypothetical protein
MVIVRFIALGLFLPEGNLVKAALRALARQIGME